MAIITGDLYRSMVGIPIAKDLVLTTPESIERIW